MLRLVALAALAGCSSILGINDPTRTDAPPIGDACGFTQLSAGREFTCGLASDATVWCWGRNGEGQAAPGGPAAVLAAMQVTLPSAAAEVRAGRNSACARLVDGAVWCWGDNASGALGDGTTSGHGPTLVALGSERAVELAVGARHACIRRELDSAIMCWGDNTDFALGNTGAVIQPTPALVVGTAGSASITTGHRNACITDPQGRPQCWGRNSAGELGTAGPSRAQPMPMTGVDRVTTIAATGRNSCVLEPTNELRCWGRNNSGQLGDGSYTGATLPGPVTLSNVADVKTMPDSMLSIGTDGVVSGWGTVALDGSYGVRPTPTRSTLTNVTGLTAGYYHYCAFVEGEPRCWGTNNAGELGRGVRSFSDTPSPVTLAGTVDALAVSYFSDACVRVGTTLQCWGLNSYSEVGDGTLFARVTPAAVATGLSAIDGVSMLWLHSCAWGGGAVSCWGDNRSGQLGNGSTAPRGAGPVTAAITGVTSVATGSASTCALTNTGAVKCWGAGSLGRLGNGSNAASLTPVDVTGVSNATALAQGQSHACAIAGGTVSCWGSNSEGQLGDGSTVDRSTAVPVTLPATPTKIALGFAFTCALLSSGKIYCWGINDNGQLGVGDKLNRSQPTEVLLPSGSTAADVFAGVNGACARLATNAVLCWGDTIGSPVVAPVSVTALDGATAIDIGSEGGCATRFGQVTCWGSKVMRADAAAPDWDALPVTQTCPRGM